MTENQITQVVITTVEFRRGQFAAKADAAKDPDTVPNQDLLARMGPEFKAGYNYEWAEYVAPFQGGAQ